MPHTQRGMGGGRWSALKGCTVAHFSLNLRWDLFVGNAVAKTSGEDRTRTLSAISSSHWSPMAMSSGYR